MYTHLPLSFELNVGQASSQVRALAHGAGYTLFLTSTAAVFSLSNGPRGTARRRGLAGKSLPAPAPHALLVGNALRAAPPLTQSIIGFNYEEANPHPVVVGLDKLPGYSNYFIGNDRRTWRSHVVRYARIMLRDVYPGIDLIYYGHNGRLEYDWRVHAGADPTRITMHILGTQRMSLGPDGALHMQTAAGLLVQHLPMAYQRRHGGIHRVAARYRLEQHDRLGMVIGSHNTRTSLVIDPVLVYSTFLGGSYQSDFGQGIAVDTAGNIYVTGYTDAVDFPTVNAVQSTFQSTQAVFVTKLTAGGKTFVYSTFLGGNTPKRGSLDQDAGYAIAVDAAGNAYVTGRVSTTTFPVVNAYTSTLQGASDAFVTKLSATGSTLLYSTYLGGSDGDDGAGIAVDAAGNAYVTGDTYSPDFPTINAYQSVAGSAFVTKLSPSGNSLVYSTYLISTTTPTATS